MDRSDYLLEFLGKEYNFQKSGKLLLSVFEIVIGIVVGAFLPAMAEDPNNWQIFVFCSCLLIYLIITYRRLTQEKSFSVSALGELKSTLDLKSAKSEIHRKNVSYQYIDDAVRSLNGQTCSIDSTVNSLCDMELVTGLNSVYHSLIKKTSSVLNTEVSEFSIGAHLKAVRELPLSANGTSQFNPKTLILKDDVRVLENIPHNILENQTLVNLQFDLQNQLRDTDRHQKFANKLYKHDGRTFRIISAPIPQICESSLCDGSIFIIAESLSDVPNELDNFLKILGRLFTNWLSKYDECVSVRKKQGYWKDQNGKIYRPGEAAFRPVVPNPFPPVPVTTSTTTTSSSSITGWTSGIPPEIAQSENYFYEDSTNS